MSPNVVITGFSNKGPKGDNENSLSSTYAKRLSKKPFRGYTIIPRILSRKSSSFDSDIYRMATKDLARLIILCEAKATSQILIESRAMNHEYQNTHPRVNKNSAYLVEEYFRDSFDTNVPVEKLKHIQKIMPIPARISRNAGTGKSNQLYYECLYCIYYDAYTIPALLIQFPWEDFDYEDYREMMHTIITHLSDR